MLLGRQFLLLTLKVVIVAVGGGGVGVVGIVGFDQAATPSHQVLLLVVQDAAPPSQTAHGTARGSRSGGHAS